MPRGASSAAVHPSGGDKGPRNGKKASKNNLRDHLLDFRVFVPLVIGLLAFVVVISLFLAQRAVDISSFDEIFQVDGADRTFAVASRFERSFEEVELLGAVWSARVQNRSAEVLPVVDEIIISVRSALLGFGPLTGIGFVEHVLNGTCLEKHIERMQQAYGYRDYYPTQFNANGNLERLVPDRDSYALLVSTAERAYTDVVGLDIAASPVRKNLMDIARAENRLAITKPLLLQFSSSTSEGIESRLGFSAYTPVFSLGAIDPGTPHSSYNSSTWTGSDPPDVTQIRSIPPPPRTPVNETEYAFIGWLNSIHASNALAVQVHDHSRAQVGLKVVAFDDRENGVLSNLVVGAGTDLDVVRTTLDLSGGSTFVFGVEQVDHEADDEIDDKAIEEEEALSIARSGRRDTWGRLCKVSYAVRIRDAVWHVFVEADSRYVNRVYRDNALGILMGGLVACVLVVAATVAATQVVHQIRSTRLEVERQRERQERKAKTAMQSTIAFAAHELRNPLQVVLGELGMFEEDEGVRRALHAVDMMQRKLEQMSLVASMGLERRPVLLSAVSTSQMVSTAVKAALGLRRSDVNVTLSAPPVVVLDKEAFTKALTTSLELASRYRSDSRIRLVLRTEQLPLGTVRRAAAVLAVSRSHGSKARTNTLLESTYDSSHAEVERSNVDQFGAAGQQQHSHHFGAAGEQQHSHHFGAAGQQQHSHHPTSSHQDSRDGTTPSSSSSSSSPPWMHAAAAPVPRRTVSLSMHSGCCGASDQTRVMDESSAENASIELEAEALRQWEWDPTIPCPASLEPWGLADLAYPQLSPRRGRLFAPPSLAHPVLAYVAALQINPSHAPEAFRALIGSSSASASASTPTSTAKQPTGAVPSVLTVAQGTVLSSEPSAPAARPTASAKAVSVSSASSASRPWMVDSAAHFPPPSRVMVRYLVADVHFRSDAVNPRALLNALARLGVAHPHRGADLWDERSPGNTTARTYSSTVQGMAFSLSATWQSLHDQRGFLRVFTIDGTATIQIAVPVAPSLAVLRDTSLDRLTRQIASLLSTTTTSSASQPPSRSQFSLSRNLSSDKLVSPTNPSSAPAFRTSAPLYSFIDHGSPVTPSLRVGPQPPTISASAAALPSSSPATATKPKSTTFSTAHTQYNRPISLERPGHLSSVIRESGVGIEHLSTVDQEASSPPANYLTSMEEKKSAEGDRPDQSAHEKQTSFGGGDAFSPEKQTSFGGGDAFSPEKHPSSPKKPSSSEKPSSSSPLSGTAAATKITIPALASSAPTSAIDEEEEEEGGRGASGAMFEGEQPDKIEEEDDDEEAGGLDSSHSSPTGKRVRSRRMRKKKSSSLFAGRHFLVVDDEETVRELLLRMLVAEGATVDVLEDGDLVEAYLDRKHALPTPESPSPSSHHHGIDAILMDIAMLRSDGAEVTRRLVHLRNIRIPIIAVTANHQQWDRERFHVAGFAAVAGKPIHAKGLRSVLRSVLPQ